MNITFQRVAAFCGLRLSYYITAALLAISFLGLILSDYRTTSPLYILLFQAVLPSFMKAIFFSNTTNRKMPEQPLSFPLFCKKYNYDRIQHKSMNLAYFLLFILLGAWHISYSRADSLPDFITALPFGISVISLLLRFLINIGYRIYFHCFPLKAMH